MTNENNNKQVDFSIAEKWNGIAAIVGCVAAFTATLSLDTSFLV